MLSIVNLYIFDSKFNWDKSKSFLFSANIRNAQNLEAIKGTKGSNQVLLLGCFFLSNPPWSSASRFAICLVMCDNSVPFQIEGKKNRSARFLARFSLQFVPKTSEHARISRFQGCENAKTNSWGNEAIILHVCITDILDRVSNPMSCTRKSLRSGTNDPEKAREIWRPRRRVSRDVKLSRSKRAHLLLLLLFPRLRQKNSKRKCYLAHLIL